MDNEPVKLYFKALYKDGTEYRCEFNHPDKPYNGEMKIPDVLRYFIVDEQDRIFHGVDLENRILVVSGSVIHTDLSEGDYELVSHKTTQEEIKIGTAVDEAGQTISNIDSKILNTRFCFGLQRKGRRTARLVYINPDGSFTFETK